MFNFFSFLTYGFINLLLMISNLAFLISADAIFPTLLMVFIPAKAKPYLLKNHPFVYGNLFCVAFDDVASFVSCFAVNFLSVLSTKKPSAFPFLCKMPLKDYLFKILIHSLSFVARNCSILSIYIEQKYPCELSGNVTVISISYLVNSAHGNVSFLGAMIKKISPPRCEYFFIFLLSLVKINVDDFAVISDKVFPMGL